MRPQDQKASAARPTSIECESCGAGISDLIEVDVRSMPGVQAAFSGQCACGVRTLSLIQDIDRTKARREENMRAAMFSIGAPAALPPAYVLKNETGSGRLLVDFFKCGGCAALVFPEQDTTAVFSTPVDHSIQFAVCVHCDAPNLVVSAKDAGDFERLEPLIKQAKKSMGR